MARAGGLVAAVRGAGAFVADTAPLVYRVERGGDRRLVEACDPLFDAVARGELACLVSSVSAAELFVGGFKVGAAAVTALDAFLRSPGVGVVPPRLEVAAAAGRLVARGRVGRLADALVAATALELGLPLLTADRRLARSGAVEALLLSDYA